MQPPQTMKLGRELEWNPEWEIAAKEELKSMADHGVWTLIYHPTDKKVIRSRWDFTDKHDPNIVRFKARFTGQGFFKAVDYTDSYFPVPSMANVKLSMTMDREAQNGCHHHQPETAYLHSKLDIPVYREQPEGSKVFKLNSEQLHQELAFCAGVLGHDYPSAFSPASTARYIHSARLLRD
ncbi:hypothetical protein P7C70_g5919, partial [Phenoliferia sp. Uapishka_3]